MNRLLLALILLCIGQTLAAQYTYTIKADSVKITNSCDTAELILENHTQNVPGFLYNKGRGRTEFRRAAVKLNDSMYVIGVDTLKIRLTALNGLSGNNGNVVLGQDVGQAGNPAILLSDREIPMNLHNIKLNGGDLVFSGAGSVENPVLQFWDNTRGIWSQGANQITIKAGTSSFLTLFTAGSAHTGVNISDVPSATPTARLSIKQQAPIGDTGGVANLVDMNATFAPAVGSQNFHCLFISPVINQTGSASGVSHGIYINPTLTSAADFRAIEVATGKSILNGKVTVNSSASPTAGLLLGAGTSTSGTAPLKLTAGTILSFPEDGAIEYDGTDYYITAGSTRYTLSKTLAGQITTNFGGPSLSAFNAVTTTLTVAGVQPGDVVNVSANNGAANPASIIITAYVTSANTVTLQAYNASNSAVTLASDTYKVKVIR